eukprot:11264626-Alexandrium_andersonii.AAC.1
MALCGLSLGIRGLGRKRRRRDVQDQGTYPSRVACVSSPQASIFCARARGDVRPLRRVVVQR